MMSTAASVSELYADGDSDACLVVGRDAFSALLKLAHIVVKRGLSIIRFRLSCGARVHRCCCAANISQIRTKKFLGRARTILGSCVEKWDRGGEYFAL